nr:PREDICTED: cartilage acidic protein 1 [Apteryx mantelli mantelli]
MPGGLPGGQHEHGHMSRPHAAQDLPGDVTCVQRGLPERGLPAWYNGPNLVLKYDKARGRLVNVAQDERGSPYYALRDRQGNAIGVAACDIDGDGREEIYFLNTNNAFSGMATYTDKLFKLRNGRWEDILSDEVNRDVASRFAGPAARQRLRRRP